jgi:hypothetical protein
MHKCIGFQICYGLLYQSCISKKTVLIILIYWRLRKHQTVLNSPYYLCYNNDAMYYYNALIDYWFHERAVHKLHFLSLYNGTNAV